MYFFKTLLAMSEHFTYVQTYQCTPRYWVFTIHKILEKMTNYIE